MRVLNYIVFIKEILSWKIDPWRRSNGYQIIHCFGDSHVTMFSVLQREGLLAKTLLRPCIVHGATAMGLVNPNSKTNALKIFKRQIRFVQRENYLLFMLGEVDCGFVIWYRAKKHDLPVTQQFDESLTNYKEFVLDLMKRGYTNIIIATAPLPTILDGQNWGEVANARREVTATLRERTDLTLQYNSALRNFCQEHNLLFLDFEADILNPITSLVQESFLNENPLDHHLDNKKIAPVLVDHLRDMSFI